MALPDRLKERRTALHMTQQAAAEALGVSPQTVSKWERGILSPDVALLPRIAVLYRCSLDSLFSMETLWGEEHREKLRGQIRQMTAAGDHEGVYQTYLHLIEMEPEQYTAYAEVMFWVLRLRMFEAAKLKKMLALAERADARCENREQRYEIYCALLRIAWEAEDGDFREKAKKFYIKLPRARHSQEMNVRYVALGAEHRAALQRNILYGLDVAESALCTLGHSCPAEERRFLYEKAAALYETVLDGRFGGFIDVPLMKDYRTLVEICMEQEDAAGVEVYMTKLLSVMERHLPARADRTPSPLVDSASATFRLSAMEAIRGHLQWMKSREALAAYYPRMGEMEKAVLDELDEKEKSV